MDEKYDIDFLSIGFAKIILSRILVHYDKIELYDIENISNAEQCLNFFETIEDKFTKNLTNDAFIEESIPEELEENITEDNDYFFTEEEEEMTEFQKKTNFEEKKENLDTDIDEDLILQDNYDNKCSILINQFKENLKQIYDELAMKVIPFFC